ncbi:disulfide bond formation protein B [Alloalcanivorax xenomutans]|jgi:protein dithiol:quinone oxidoreductase|uniref:disulfide bond formation protein B n=1 Tax=Alloalcanivorax xenomutans TaxID=1094342 RepID=UPI0003B813F0|nr:disulfide bond formation protein B [Alloalcanivorax xenomutans]ERS10556.1 dihydrolipoamide acetyltransferase [Alcanivorax sp. PN-3]KYZ86517.1 disulfide bond formation protein DsbB [Alcanivorax sp. KX64203]MBA4722576.1 disulfide bond formation protein B [Alcanivorax sp.]MCE7524672.1 disulfide bond formation protein B [Alloalcanivorax xenomutans]PHS58068.1 MAG: disulfide bond formation protein B [Alcanivorax sp.]|tara:strand:+ start:743 stop:1246 length:504 start_codon:yes stop_codon:yes gene_type:complete
MWSKLPSPRALNGLALLACVIAMASALYLQHVDGLEPCPLCIFQRIAVFAAMAILLVAFLHGPRGIGVRIYAVLTALAALVGGGIAIRHLWLQSLPPDQVPGCGPGLDYMLDVFPLHDVLAQVLSGSGECAEISWTFLGLSIPGWSLVVFTGLLLFALVQLFRPLRA